MKKKFNFLNQFLNDNFIKYLKLSVRNKPGGKIIVFNGFYKKGLIVNYQELDKK